MPHWECLCISELHISPQNNVHLHKSVLNKNCEMSNIVEFQGIFLQVSLLILGCSWHCLKKMKGMKKLGFLFLFLKRVFFTFFIFDAAVWTGGTASLSSIVSFPGWLLATCTGVWISKTPVPTIVPVIFSTFFSLSYPDQSCTKCKGQEKCKLVHFDAGFFLSDFSKLQFSQSEKENLIHQIVKSCVNKDDSFIKCLKATKETFFNLAKKTFSAWPWDKIFFVTFGNILRLCKD